MGQRPRDQLTICANLAEGDLMRKTFSSISQSTDQSAYEVLLWTPYAHRIPDLHSRYLPLVDALVFNMPGT